jgi:DNA-binding CsgD family transcriptional regulator
MGQENIAATFASFLVRIEGARGDGDALGRWEPTARAAVEASGNRFERLQLDHALGLLSLAQDRLEDAVQRLAAVAREVEEQAVLDRDLAPEPDLVEALVRLGRRDEAAAALARWVERGAEGARAWAPPLVARCRGLVADGDGDWDAVLDSAATVGDPYATARTALLAGESLRRRNLRVEARRHLASAVETFERLEAAAWAERGRRELRASGAKLRRGAEAGDELTPQELQVALQVAEGKANKEVAAALFLSPKTIEFHLGRIYRKLGVASRAELARRIAVAGGPAPG